HARAFKERPQRDSYIFFITIPILNCYTAKTYSPYLYFCTRKTGITCPRDKTAILQDKAVILKNKTAIPKDKAVILENKTVILKNKTLILQNKTAILQNKTVILKNKTLILKNKTLIPQDKTASIRTASYIHPKKRRDP
ncbi:MAG: hypothetical protein LBQ22_00520, partial [Bacteroidales bacterium]|nr:hypothetical protein [Bacteroidales bacterium]